MSVRCAACAAEGPDGMRFCGHCGAPLPAAPGAPLAELRQLTVLFCDLVASTRLAELLDPEELREVTREYHAACAGVVRRFDGHVAQYLGDGVLVYFGYPAAHEDDARRAVRAGLGVVDAIARLAPRLAAERGVELRVRVGVHTGPVVVGDVGDVGGEARSERLALGRTPNVAARVQQAAAPGSVAVSDATYRLVRGFFAWEELGAHEVKGIAEPLMLHRPLAESGAESRLDVARATGLTPFVGREEEMARLDAAWARVAAGRGHAVLLRGEAGIGKSRVVGVFKERRRAEATAVLECFCSPYFETSELHPIIGLIERELGFAADSDPAERRVVLAARLARRGIDAPDALPLMASLLDIPLDDPGALAGLAPQRRRQRTLETLLAWLVANAAARPAVLVVEDLHWADPTTIEFLGMVLAAGPAARLLTLLTFRPGFAAPWEAGEDVSRLALARLSAAETSAMTARVARNKHLPPEVLARLVARTEGVPLYVEEVTKAVLEAGVLTEHADRYELAGAVPADLIPDTVQGSLTARLDRLGAAKPVAQLASTLGREFGYDLLAAVARLDDGSLRRHLARLVETELVYQRGEPPDATYLFKHALIQDAAYQSLLRRTRQDLHRRIAETLVERFPQVAEAQPELLAQHYAGAGLAAEAVAQWRRAGQRALDRAAVVEAVAHLSRGLQLLATLPATPETQRAELDFQLALAPALMIHKGWAAPEVEAACARARDLSERLGDGQRLFGALWGMWAFHFLGGRLDAALDVAQQVAGMASAAGVPPLRVMAHHAVGFTQMYRGEFAESCAEARRGIALYGPEQERGIVAQTQLSSTVCCHTFLGVGEWMLGHAGAAEGHLADARRVAEALAHPPTLAFAITFPIWFHAIRRDSEQMLVAAAEAMALARTEAYLMWIPCCMIGRGWARAVRGDAGGIDELRQGRAMFVATGSSVTNVLVSVMLAEALLAAGRADEALAELRAGAADAVGREEHLCEPDVHRLEGEILLARAGALRDDALAADAEGALRRAAALARGQAARALELRAALALARALQLRGAPDRARETLDELLARCGDVDVPEAGEARALAARLGGARAVGQAEPAHAVPPLAT